MNSGSAFLSISLSIFTFSASSLLFFFSICFILSSYFFFVDRSSPPIENFLIPDCWSLINFFSEDFCALDRWGSFSIALVVFLKPASKACFASSMNFAYFSGFFFAAFFAKIKSLILVAMVVALRQAVEYPEICYEN